MLWLTIISLIRFKHSVALGALVITLGCALSLISLDLGTDLKGRLPDEFSKGPGGAIHLATANRLVVVLHARNGNVYAPHFMTLLRSATDYLAEHPAIRPDSVVSLWRAPYHVYVPTDNGIAVDALMPTDPTAFVQGHARVDALHRAVVHAGFEGYLVTADRSAAIIVAEVTEEVFRLKAMPDYAGFLAELKEGLGIRVDPQAAELQIIGPSVARAKAQDRVDELIAANGLALVVIFFALIIATFSPVIAGIIFATCLAGALWGLAAFAVIAPALGTVGAIAPLMVMMVSILTGLLNMHRLERVLIRGAPIHQCLKLFLRERAALTLGIFSAVAAAGFAMILMPLNALRVAGLLIVLSAIGAVLAHIFLFPVLISFLAMPKEFCRHLARTRAAQRTLFRPLRQLFRDATWIPLLIAALSIGLAVFMAREPLSPGTNAETEYAWVTEAEFPMSASPSTSAFYTALNTLDLKVSAPVEVCLESNQMRSFDRFIWKLRNVGGVSAVLALPSVVREAFASGHAGHPKWRVMPRNSIALIETVSEMPPVPALLDASCRTLSVRILAWDHKKETVDSLNAAVAGFSAATAGSGWTITVVGGSLSAAAVQYDALSQGQTAMLLYALSAILLVLFVAFGGLRPLVCGALGTLSVMGVASWILTLAQVPLTIETVPWAAFAAVVGLPPVAFLFQSMERLSGRGRSAAIACRLALADLASAIAFGALVIALTGAVWAVAGIPAYADFGLYLIALSAGVLVVGLIVMPAIYIAWPPRAGSNGKPASTFPDPALT